MEEPRTTPTVRPTMRAVVREAYGPPEVLRVTEVPTPAPDAGEVLVEVRAASVNPADWRRLRGDPWIVRLGDGPLRSRARVLGADVAGVVVAAGAGATRFRPGDEVFGELAAGGFAEYARAPQDRLAPKPPALSFADAAAVPLAAVTALQALRDAGRVRPGQRVLVNGASGGVGTFAVQLAAAFGASVTGVCSGRNAELVRGLGAERVIDYTQEDFARGEARGGATFDLILDVVGDRTVAEYARALTPGGTCVVIGFTTVAHMLGLLLRGAWTSRTSARTITPLNARATPEDLELLGRMLEAGDLKPVIDRRYRLDEVPEAVRYVETGRARGKVVVADPEPADRSVREGVP